MSIFKFCIIILFFYFFIISIIIFVLVFIILNSNIDILVYISPVLNYTSNTSNVDTNLPTFLCVQNRLRMIFKMHDCYRSIKWSFCSFRIH